MQGLSPYCSNFTVRSKFCFHCFLLRKPHRMASVLVSLPERSVFSSWMGDDTVALIKCIIFCLVQSATCGRCYFPCSHDAKGSNVLSIFHFPGFISVLVWCQDSWFRIHGPPFLQELEANICSHTYFSEREIWLNQLSRKTVIQRD